MRILLVNVSLVGRSYEHFPDGFEFHLLRRLSTFRYKSKASDFLARFDFREREFFIDNLLVRIRLIVVMNLVDWPCAIGA